MKPIYDTNLIIASDVIEQSFNANGESNECLYCINEYNIKASSNKNSAYIPSDKCIPVRMCFHVEDNTEDWVKYGSPISEIDFGNILKYWPAEIMDMKTGDQITIEYPDFIINAKLINNKEIFMKDEEVKDETVKTADVKEEPKAKVETEKKVTKTDDGKKATMPKWAKAAIVGTTAAVVIGIVSGLILKKKHENDNIAIEDNTEDAE